jgi:hypothetical protein
MSSLLMFVSKKQILEFSVRSLHPAECFKKKNINIYCRIKEKIDVFIEFFPKNQYLEKSNKTYQRPRDVPC